jgi:hypothetical protein
MGILKAGGGWRTPRPFVDYHIAKRRAPKKEHGAFRYLKGKSFYPLASRMICSALRHCEVM